VEPGVDAAQHTTRRGNGNKIGREEGGRGEDGRREGGRGRGRGREGKA